MLARRLSIVLTVALSATVAGQSPIPVAAEFEKLHFRSLGPSIMSGRISDLAVYEAKPSTYYVGTAHGGVWKTTTNGTLFTPILQDQGLMSIGDVAVSQTNPDLVWVGTGEANNRQSTSWGEGVYKSTDGGKTFTNMGLKESKHIGRILIDPSNNDVVIVAAQGPLFGFGGDRGVYKTTDGGKTWTQTLKVDDMTGATDLAMSYTDPKTIYAATYQRLRTACCMNGGGPGSGLWKSTDGGDHWTRISGNGWPEGSLGRIGVDTYRKNGNIVYANVEGPAAGGGRGGGRGAAAQAGQTAAGRGGAADTSSNQGSAFSTGVYRSDNGGASWTKVSSVNPRPMYFSQMRIDPNDANRLYMGGVSLHMSNDGGKTFETRQDIGIHDDIHAIWIDPSNSSHVMIGGDGGLGSSNDMGQTWVAYQNIPAGLFYHVSYDMETPFNVCGGMQDNYDWCGPSQSRHNQGILTHEWFQIQGGDGFEAVPDKRDSRIIYTESQDGNLTRKNILTGESKSIRPSQQNSTGLNPGENLRFQWDTPILLSPTNPGVLYVGANRLMKSTDRGDSYVAISPDLTTNTDRDTVVTMGLRGADIRISKDDGIVSYSTIMTIAESPKNSQVIYTGSDDGVVSVTKDGGKSWSNITSHIPGFPKGAFVSEVVASQFDPATVYVTSDNHRLNDYSTHIWVSNDFGATFKSINANVSTEVAKTLTEDPKNADVLYVGTERGILVSLDRGSSWRWLRGNLPTVRVDEITFHPRDNAMLVATHGRALWILDHPEPIQEYAAANAASTDAKLFTIPSALEWKTRNDQNSEFWGHQFFVGENPPNEAVINYFVKKPVSDLKFRIADASGKQVREISAPAGRNQPGVQTVCWDYRLEQIPGTPTTGGFGFGGGGGRGGNAAPSNAPNAPIPQANPGYLPMNPCGGAGAGGGGGFGFGGGGAAPNVAPGSYTVSLVADGKVIDTKPLKLTFDPELHYTEAMNTRYFAPVAELHSMQRRATEVQTALNTVYNQLGKIDSTLNARSDVPASAKTQFANFRKDFDAVRPKFGVPALAPQQPAGGRGGGRGGAGPVDTVNVVNRIGNVKNQISAIWEIPSETLARQYADVKAVAPRTIDEGNAILGKAASLANELKKYGVSLTVPPAVK